MTKLYAEDQARVDQVLKQGANQTERKPFRFWTLLFSLVGVLVLVSLAGYFVGLAFDFA